MDGSIVAYIEPAAYASNAERTSACEPTGCGSCKLHGACMLAGAASDTVVVPLRIKRGEALYRAGDHFRSLYIVRSGFFKTVSLTEDGRDQVTGFHMGNEVIGMDGIEDECHSLTAIALEDSNVCSVPFSLLEMACLRQPALQHRLFRLMGKELVRSQELSVLIGSMRAEERVAAFLVDLSHRHAERGYSAAEFHLRMTREEIGSYLGLKLETVSRAFSRFQDMGLLTVSNKHISGLDLAGLADVTEESLRAQSA